MHTCLTARCLADERRSIIRRPVQVPSACATWSCAKRAARHDQLAGIAKQVTLNNLSCRGICLGKNHTRLLSKLALSFSLQKGGGMMLSLCSFLSSFPEENRCPPPPCLVQSYPTCFAWNPEADPTARCIAEAALSICSSRSCSATARCSSKL